MNGDSIINIQESSQYVYEILQKYIAIHDQIFKPSLRKATPIPGFFQPINFHSHYEDLGLLSKELEKFVAIDNPGESQDVFEKYAVALRDAIIGLRLLCEKLGEKSDGQAYSMDEYNEDVASYNKLAEEYQRIGPELNLHLSRNGMMGGLVKRPKSRMLLSHFVHIFAGLLFPNIFLWTSNGITVVILFSLITQGIDRIRLYRHYQREFELDDKIRGIRNGQSAKFKKDNLLKHAQTLIVKVFWYALVTVVCAQLRR